MPGSLGIMVSVSVVATDYSVFANRTRGDELSSWKEGFRLISPGARESFRPRTFILGICRIMAANSRGAVPRRRAIPKIFRADP